MAAHADRSAWKRLGQMLESRRVELDVRYANRRLFCEERGLDYRLAYDLETAARVNYRRPTLRAAEVSYGLAPSSIDDALAGGELTPSAVPHEIGRRVSPAARAEAEVEFMAWFTEAAMRAGRTERERRAFRREMGWDDPFASPAPDLDDYGMWRRLAVFLKRPALELMRAYGVISDEDFPQPPPDRAPGRREERRQARP